MCPTDANGRIRQTLYPLQVGYRPRGQSGIEVSDWWPHVGSCIDDIAVVRSLWTTDNNHGAQLQFHTGRHVLEGQFPTIGSWVHYGLGSLNDDLPQFVVLGTPIADCCGGLGGHGASYLGPEHDGVQLSVDPLQSAAVRGAGREVFREEQAHEFELMGRLNRLSAVNTLTILPCVRGSSRTSWLSACRWRCPRCCGSATKWRRAIGFTGWTTT